MLMEEPVPPDNIDSLAWVRDKAEIPIAAGERIYMKYGFREALEKKALDIAQPDIFHTGGIGGKEDSSHVRGQSHPGILP